MMVTSGSQETVGTAKRIPNKALNIFALYNLVYAKLFVAKHAHVTYQTFCEQLPNTFAPLEVKIGKKALSKEGNS